MELPNLRFNLLPQPVGSAMSPMPEPSMTREILCFYVTFKHMAYLRWISLPIVFFCLTLLTGTTEIRGQGLSPGSPAKEYIYSGGRLVAVQTPGIVLAASLVSGPHVNLSWTDMFSNETGFKVERKMGVGDVYTQVASLGANQTTWSDSNLSLSVSYYYRVSVFNSSGTIAYSNEACVTTPGPVYASAVSVRIGDFVGINKVMSPGVAVRKGSITDPIPLASPAVSVTMGPNVSSISPPSVSRGFNGTLTITGANFLGASQLMFFDANRVRDTGITYTGLTVNGDGTSLTANVSIPSGSALGKRVVTITATAGVSPSFEIGTNTFSIVP